MPALKKKSMVLEVKRHLNVVKTIFGQFFGKKEVAKPKHAILAKEGPHSGYALSDSFKTE